MVDIAVAVVILVFAVGSLSSAVVASLEVARTNEETSLANARARRMAEELRSLPFREVFARFNQVPDDDPEGPGTAEGPGFDVRELTPTRDDPDGLVGEIRFPVFSPAAGVVELREDLVDADMGMPRDLNLDGDAEDDASLDYRILPVTVRLSWTGISGPRAVEYHLLLND